MADDLVSIGQFDSYVEAEIAKQRLDDAGIRAVITGDDSSNILGGIDALAHVDVEVMEHDAKRALEILQSKTEEE